MPNIPSPLYAIVGATEAAAKQAKALPAKVSEYSASRKRPIAFDPRSIDLPKLDLSKFDMPKVDVAAVTGTAFEWAARAERTYEDLVTRGADVVDRVTGNDADPGDVTPIATPESAAAKAIQPKPAAKPAPKPAQKKTTNAAGAAKATPPKDSN